jgi:hypothetical protein
MPVTAAGMTEEGVIAGVERDQANVPVIEEEILKEENLAAAEGILRDCL